MLAKQNGNCLQPPPVDVAIPEREPSYNDLTLHPKPWSLITSKIWGSWRARLGSKKDRRISDVAAAIKLKWPANGRAITLDSYLSLPFENFIRLERMIGKNE
jgi:hypothetical protein